jgi:dienelactone hydrolase
MARIFISHPYAGDPDRNRARVRGIARRLAFDGHLPLAPHLYLPQFLNDASERDLALGICLGLMRLADEVRLYGKPTEGMRVEVAEAGRCGIPIVTGGPIAD